MDANFIQPHAPMQPRPAPVPSVPPEPPVAPTPSVASPLPVAAAMPVAQATTTPSPPPLPAPVTPITLTPPISNVAPTPLIAPEPPVTPPEPPDPIDVLIASSENPPSTGNLSRGQRIAVAVSAVIMLALGVTVIFLLNGKSITSWEVLAASNSAAEMRTDTTGMSSSVKSMEVATTLTDLNSTNASLASKLVDAQKQYNLLLTSPVLKDGQTNTAFTAFKAKWAPYSAFVRGTSSDYKTLGPILVALSNAQESALSASRQSNGNLSAELAQYQALITTTSQQISFLKMQTTVDQQMVAALDTYIKNSNDAIAQAKADVASGKSLNVITGDITNIAGAATTLSNTQESLASSAAATLQQDDPTNTLNSFITALNGLSTRV